MRARRLIHEQAVTFVVIQAQHLVGEVADNQVRLAAAIVIGGIAAHRAARHAVLAEGYAGGHALLAKLPVLQIAVQLIRLRVVGNEQVGPAVPSS